MSGAPLLGSRAGATGQLGKRCSIAGARRQTAGCKRQRAAPAQAVQRTEEKDQQSRALAARVPDRAVSLGGPSSSPEQAEPDGAPAARNWVQQQTVDRWTNLASRNKLVAATSIAFCICNMDKVNISVAIMPMASDYGWSSSVSGLIQSAFFYGYMLTQIPGGWVTARLGGRRVMPAGVTLWSVATAAVPLLAGTLPGLCLSRAAVGLGEGVAPSASTDMVSRVIPNNRRSQATSYIFGGLHLGSLLGLLIAPPLIEQFGWRSVFYFFGAVGLLWSLWWERLMGDCAVRDPEFAEALEGRADKSDVAVPWRAFLRNPATRALAAAHFTNNWFHYTMLAWLPTYFTDTMNLSISQAAQFSLLPPLAALGTSAIAGSAADALISAGWDVAVVRKSAQCVAFLGPAGCLLGASLLQNSYAPLALITVALGLASCSLAGLYCNHGDLSPKYAAILLGLTNTTAALPGILGVAFTGALLDATGSWPIALFLPSGILFVIGSAIFVVYGRAELQDFSDCSPFWFEKYLQPVTSRLPAKLPGLDAAARVASKLSSKQDKES